ncbi:MAG TPA: ABC transporter substrate-binding protein [Stellaceae bacterium]|nr:ABC transporter substrate-binding protein [Stellaceae bacterium]
MPHSNLRRALAGLAALFPALLTGAAPALAADAIKIGTVKVPASGAVYIAQEKGYFAAEGVPAELVFFDSGQPIAVAATSGAIDFGATAISAGFYSLAGQGDLRIIAAAAEDVPHFESQAFLVSTAAYDAGFTSLKDFPGHSYALSQIGSSAQYALGLVADKYGFALSSVRILPLQSISNAVNAVAGGRADITLNSVTAELPAVRDGKGRILAYLGDERSYQFGIAFTSTQTANTKLDLVARFLRAYKKGARDYHDAFAGPDGARVDGPTAPAILAILGKYISLPPEQLAKAVSYIDADARLDTADVAHQIAWFKSQNLLKGDVDTASLIDRRYVVSLPQR